MLLNEKRQVVKIYASDITDKEVEALLKDYERLISNETDFNKIVTENEIKLNAILHQLSIKNSGRYLYPIFQQFIEEYETRKKLNNRVKEAFKIRVSILWSTINEVLIRTLNYLLNKLKK